MLLFVGGLDLFVGRAGDGPLVLGLRWRRGVHVLWARRKEKQAQGLVRGALQSKGKELRLTSFAYPGPVNKTMTYD